MILSRFYSRDMRCTACNKFLEDERIILVPENGKGCYCLDCKGRKFTETDGDEREKYIAYSNNGKLALRIVDKETVNGLENGIHRLDLDTYTLGNKFVYVRRKMNNNDLKSFYESGVRWYHVLEKNNDFMCLFFPLNEIGDEFSLFRFSAPDIDLFCQYTGTDVSELGFLIAEGSYYNEVMGIITKAGMSGESLIVKNCFDDPIRETSMSDIIRRRDEIYKQN